ncbi:glycerol-3-phosphate dehydrogenase [Lichenihabitans sp. Uapishka_5]|uniref:glycerol-3-phosphate dehydrogenase n=1 Tax=Lichenihabitans sp. Uapishka_5 TaxID=3037302 RepID=UPI0029E828DD|nr:glycerol-3-phosphate dehydrogenase [Lichenihabitans sp. Uapishka_5]MDX7952751.1 glycerol-3-phosphate dehydrogenase [Lichenihabitans sp. Uapishka_5]
MDTIYDLAVIGGGINGCGIARDAAGRGLKVLLCEQNDLASGTSSAATKLIHGGLRYLEHYEFRLVREALMEREVLWGIAPHIVWPLRFVLPYHKGLRPAWMLRLGLFLYDHLGGRKRLPATRTLDLRRDVAGKPLKAGEFDKGFEYSDCWVDDARMVALNARDAADRGAVVLTRTKAVSAERGSSEWSLTLQDRDSGASRTVRAKAVVNAAGPWAGSVLNTTLRQNTAAKVRLVQGSHIVVPKIYDHDRCYIFQNADNRIFFAIPYEADFTLVGTTDRDYVGDPADVKASDEEIDYICGAAAEYFSTPIRKADIVWTYSGVRPLYDKGGEGAAQAATRDYVLDLDGGAGRAPLLSVFGGKLTTYRKLAEHALQILGPHLPGLDREVGWTGRTPLPGGDFPIDGFDALVAALRRDWPFLTPRHVHRLARLYGTTARTILGKARSLDDLGRHFGDTLYAAEVDHLAGAEWARQAADVLWRRTKLGLRLTPAEAEALDVYMADRLPEIAEPTRASA